jgi:hypothetical protein
MPIRSQKQGIPFAEWLIERYWWNNKNMSKRKENFNVTQGMTLLLLKKLSLPANFVFQLILFITDPENNIGYED